MIEGTSMEGTEAAGEYVTNPNLFSRFEEQLLSASKGPSLPYFELLLKTRTLAGAPREPVSITHRVLTPPPGMQWDSSLDLP
jgi:hypothetical protein